LDKERGIMKNRLLLVVFLFMGLLLVFVSGEGIQAVGTQEPENSNAEVQKPSGKMLQFTAGGHVLGFNEGGIVVASSNHALKVEFVNAQPILPEDKGKSTSTENNGQTTDPLGKVIYQDLWPGVSLVYEKHGTGVYKSTYYLWPAGRSGTERIDQIRLRYNAPVDMDKNGDLIISFKTGQMRESKPIAWQEIEGKKVPVEISYQITEKKEVGFNIGSYDSNLPLVIDPVLSWNTFMGSVNMDYGQGVAIDSNGNVYLTGYSFSTWGTPVNAHTGSNDAFAAKLDPNGNLLWNTFMGSGNWDYGYGIAIDTSGSVHVAGLSATTWGTPVNAHAGNTDAFAAKLDTNGNLLWNTFMGSGLGDYGYDIALDAGGNAYVTGRSWAPWGNSVRAYAGDDDAFAAKLDTNGNLLWNTFMGSGSWDYGNGIAVDTGGNAYVTGYSQATWGTPVNAHTGSDNAFAAKLDTNGNLLWNTFMGSGVGDFGNDIAVDAGGNVYVTGYSSATWGTPINMYAGGDEVFATKLNTNGNLLWNTFMGSGSLEYGNGIAVDSNGNVYVAGTNWATWGNPVSTYSGDSDAFAAKLNNNGVLQWNTFMGSAYEDEGFGIAVDSNGNVYVAGYSFDTWGAPVNAHAKETYDAFVFKLIEFEPEIDLFENGTDIPDGGSYDFGLHDTGTDTDKTFTIENTGTADLTLTTPIVITGTDADQFSVQQQPGSTVASGGNTTFETRFSPTSDGAKTATIAIANNDSDEDPYDLTLTGEGFTPVPEINVMRGNRDIPDGGSFDFGDCDVGSSLQFGFTLENTGGVDLTLDGNPKVILLGDDSGQFLVTLQPTSPVTPGGDTVFKLQFTPLSTGEKKARISISNNDSDENPYVIFIRGTGKAPEINIHRGGKDIPDGGSFDFGTHPQGSDTERMFTIQNTGNADLVLTVPITLGGANAAEFCISQQPNTVIAPGGSTQFKVRFSPTSSGAKTASIAIANNDSDENPYNITYSGLCDNPPTVVITSPTAGAVIFGLVPIHATATDDIGIARVEFYADRALLGSDNTAPYNYIWDVSSFAPRQHVIKAIAYDTSGQTAEDTVNVTVNNMSIGLTASREVEQAWFVKRDYGKIVLRINDMGTLAVTKFIFYRKTAGGVYQVIKEIAPSELQNNVYTHNDLYLEKTAYTYRVVAIGQNGALVGASNEITV